MRVTVTGGDTAATMLDAYPELAKETLAAAAEFWRVNMLPKHFERSARSEYGYKKRKPETNRRKRNRPDLVKTGQTQALSRRKKLGVRADALNSPISLFIKIRVERYLYANKELGVHQLPKELTALSEGDATKVLQFMELYLYKRLDELQTGGGKETL